ncbi:MAG: hypothetical protein M1823_008615, partial [Watsoniomyces obsoletus]
MYPRVVMQRDVRELGKVLTEKAGASGQTCLVFPNQASAEECLEFARSEKRGDQRLAHQDLTIRVFDVQQRLWTVFFALENTPKMVGFWIHPGVGVSTRLAEETLKHKGQIREVQWEEATASEAA